MNELFRPISALRGVGEKRAKAYARLGIQTPYDLLFHIPRSYLDFRNPEPVLSAPLDTLCVVEGCITRKLPEQRIRIPWHCLTRESRRSSPPWTMT